MTANHGLLTWRRVPSPVEVTAPAPEPHADDAVAKSRLSLRFRDPQLESAFQADAGERLRIHVAATMCLGALTWAVTAAVLPLVYRVDPVRIYLAVGVVELLLLALFATLPRARSWSYLQTVSATVNLIGGIAIIVIATWLLDRPHLVTAALLINLVFAFGLSRFGPIGVVVTAPYVLLFCVLVATGQLRVEGFEVFLILVGFGVSAVGGYLLEATTRDGFLQRRLIAWQREALEREERKSARLLANMLPSHMVDTLRENPAAVAQRLPEVSVLFADLVGFTRLASPLTPDDLVAVLDELFSRFDTLAERHGLEKIKTIGDAYMAVASGEVDGVHHARRAVAMGLDMIEAVDSFREVGSVPLALRVGVHSGPVVAGVLGRSRLSYDMWGDTVNVASRMESQGIAGAVQVSAAVADALPPDLPTDPAGVIDVRGKGPMETYLLRP
jgi:class 3 adenylate cyclase